MTKLPLEGIRVADFTWVGAGPYTTKMLADFGAEVIKIESGVRPDVLRLSPPFKDKKKGINRSGYFSNRNTSKKSFQLDMGKQESRDLVKKLIKKSDVVTNSFTPNTMEKWELGYEEIKKLKEDIIYLSMPMQGTTGPHKDYMGFGATMNALIGFNHLTGFPDKEPVGTGTNYPDHVPNPCHAAFSIISALRYKYRTGKGQYIEVAQTESALSVLAMAVMDVANNGRIQGRRGNWVTDAAPHGAYQCKGDDKWCVISCTDEKEWSSFIEASRLEQLNNDPKFSTLSKRLENSSLLDELISNWTKQFTPREVMELLQKHGVPSGIVQNAKDLIDDDPHIKHREHFVRLNHKEMGPSIYNNPPFKLSKTPGILKRAAPLLGEDTEYVCKEIIGLTDVEFEACKKANIFQ
jgi:benzylsuccinate CoA-transferase BbsF subunit